MDRAHGGAHIYVLLEEPSAPRRRTRSSSPSAGASTLDLKPTSNVSDGLITIPGSVPQAQAATGAAHDADAARAIAAGPHSHQSPHAPPYGPGGRAAGTSRGGP